MKKIGKKIISYFLLLNILAMSFPVFELFHEHQSTIVDCFHEHQEHTNELEHQEKCSHEAHFSETPDKHICFYAHFNSPYIVTNIENFIFRKFSFDDYLLQNIRKHYLKSFQSYLLRGPPSITYFA